MNAADRHYLNCSDEDCEVASCVGRRDYEQKILNLESQLEATQRSDHDAISCFDSKCTQIQCLALNATRNALPKPLKKFKVKQKKWLISFEESDNYLEYVYTEAEKEEALRNGAQDVTGNKHFESLYKKKQDKEIDGHFDKAKEMLKGSSLWNSHPSTWKKLDLGDVNIEETLNKNREYLTASPFLPTKKQLSDHIKSQLPPINLFVVFVSHHESGSYYVDSIWSNESIAEERRRKMYDNSDGCIEADLKYFSLDKPLNP